MNIDFQAFPKIPRLSKDIIVTEKLDGTNAQVYISEDLSVIKAGSRNRWITPDNDNFGFAGWVHSNEEWLKKVLGPGRHFGEWWGQGIQRRYGLEEKRFSLFNAGRWQHVPPGLYVVPILYDGPFSEEAIQECMSRLKADGSVAAPGFMDPEGVIVYHKAAGTLFKKTFDDAHKG